MSFLIGEVATGVIACKILPLAAKISLKVSNLSFSVHRRVLESARLYMWIEHESFCMGISVMYVGESKEIE